MSVGNPALTALLDQQRQELARLQAPSIGRLGWEEAKNRLLGADDFTRFLLPELRDLTFGQLPDRQLAHLCLLREFFLRPKRQFSLEGLGLIHLYYPRLDQAQPPAVMRQRGVTSEAWRSLLQVALDFFVRTGSPSVQAPYDLMRWLGYPGRPSLLVPPGQPITNRKVQRAWPSTHSPWAGRNRLIRLLGYTFGLASDDAEQALQIDELLVAVWDGIRPLLSQTEGGFQLDLDREAVLSQVREAWICPVTRRLLPVSFRTITPYLPALPASEALAHCQPVAMPRLPDPFWLHGGPQAAEEWLETDPQVLTLRDLGAWPDLSDRLARHRRFLRATEHSAQISGRDLTRREIEFKAGRINLLSCSTTMEMGVDIGGLTAVAMNNVPPHPANFLQRAGRAGRRGETAALSFTLCKATPQGEAVFKNPLWPFVTQLGLPRVALQSDPIVQRHLNALALATFLRERTPDIRRLHTGWFFEPVDADTSSPCERFADWCESEAAELTDLKAGIDLLTRRTLLAGRPEDWFLARTAAAARRTAGRWRADLEALLVQRQGVQTQAGDSVAEKAIDFQLTRLRREYLLGELANLGFLPGYGFPTDVVPFVTTTQEDLDHRRRNANASDREDNRSRRAGYPSRHLAIAIRDYAPGTDTVLDGRVYRSSGVTLNWQVPAEAQATPEIQNLRWVWRCRGCGSTGTRLTMPERCPHCGEDDGNMLIRHRYLQPAGFSVDIRCRPHNDITIPQYIPVRDPLISLAGTDWLPLPNPALGRYRTSTEGSLFHYSDGLHGKGYALCLRCGLADSLLEDGRLPATFVQDVERQQPRSHKRLRGGRLNDHEAQCPGNESDWSILQAVRLGIATQTEVFELQVRDTDQRPVDRTTAYTLAVSLRRALCLFLGIEEGEVGAMAAPSRTATGEPGYSVYLYDTAGGGAGYVSQVAGNLPELLNWAVAALDCPRQCDQACQGCLLTNETQHHLDDLDRHAARRLLSQGFLESLALPEDRRVFGPATRLELEPLTLALQREWQGIAVRELRVYLGGEIADWEPLTWRLRADVARWVETGCRVALLAPTARLEGLSDSQCDELAALAAYTGADLYRVPSTATEALNAGRLPVLCELGSTDRRVRWAASDAVALIPGPAWGAGEPGGPFVRIAEAGPLLPLPADWPRVSPSDLHRVAPEIIALSLTHELDGPVSGFGERAWTWLETQVPPLARRLRGNVPLISVHYVDRYLRSPLTLMMLHRLFSGLLSGRTGGLLMTTAIQVETALLDRPSPIAPRLLFHDWRDGYDRLQVVERWFRETWQDFHWQEEANRDLPHARTLTLTWNDGECWSLRLDQGFGYWGLAGRQTRDFPFDNSVERQLAALKADNSALRPLNDRHPTYWYCQRELTPQA
jgi:hypothetical protein